MSSRLKESRERSQKRKKLIAQALGVDSPDGLKSVLKTGEAKAEIAKDKDRYDSQSEGESPVCKKLPLTNETADDNSKVEAEGDKEKKEDLEKDEFEDEIYTDSSTFLKGTQSANPHNDYCQHFVDTGERPQNFIRDVGLANRFEEYPKLRELIRLKDELISKTNTPPMYLKCDLEEYDLRNLKCKFDVILIEPPLEEYQRTQGAVFDRFWSWDEIERLDVSAVAAQRSFLWIWCGNAEGLDRGRQCLKRWGFRRCEDICWIKTNIKNPTHKKNLEPNAVFQRTKEHCLMGIKGTVKRSTDGDFIHANVDIDLIIEEEPEYGTKDKPVEIFHMIEHFCLGKRRLHVFGRDSTTRPGWLTLGSELTSSNFEPDLYLSMFENEQSTVTGCTEEIERLRPKSPPHTNKGERGRGARGGFGGRGGSRGRGDNSRGNRGGRSRGRSSARGRGFTPIHRGGSNYEQR